MAYHYRGRGVETEDLVQEGNLRLLQLVDEFNLEQPIRFSTFALPHLRWAMFRAVRKHGRLIHIPERDQTLLAKMRRIEERLMQDGPVSTAQLAIELDIPLEQVAALLEADETPISLEAEIANDGDDKAITLAELLPDQGEGVEEQVMQADTINQIRSAVAQLPGDEARLLALHYGHEQSFGEIEQLTGHAHNWGWRREKAALANLRQALDYYNHDPWEQEEECEAAMQRGKPPAKGDCEKCAIYIPTSRYCKHSGYTLHSPKAIKWCVPQARPE